VVYQDQATFLMPISCRERLDRALRDCVMLYLKHKSEKRSFVEIPRQELVYTCYWNEVGILTTREWFDIHPGCVLVVSFAEPASHRDLWKLGYDEYSSIIHGLANS